MDISVRRVLTREGEALKIVRLAALRESPDAFGPTWEAESQRPPHFWEGWATSASTGDAGATFFAMLGVDVVGMVGGYRPDLRNEVEVFGMWTAPTVRRNGAGSQLLQATMTWAEEGGFGATIGLWVTYGNDAATRLYASAGFRATGERRALPSNPEREVVRLVRGTEARS